MDLKNEIIYVLQEHPDGMKAREICQVLNTHRNDRINPKVEKSDVNRILYSNKAIFLSSGIVPIWKLSPSYKISAKSSSNKNFESGSTDQCNPNYVKTSKIPCVAIGSTVCYTEIDGETDEVVIVNPDVPAPILLQGAFGAMKFTPPALTLDQLKTQVSVNSPFGTAVLGKTENETFEVEVDDMIVEYRIESIQNPGYLHIEEPAEQAPVNSVHKKPNAAVSRINEIALELESLYKQKQQILTKLNFLREELAREMDRQAMSVIQTEFLNIKRDYSKKICVNHADSEAVYELLEENGYNCVTYSSTLRDKAINKIIEIEGELPYWLEDMVTVKDKTTVSITKRG